MVKKVLEIYTDGSCLGNPGPGGWAAILVFGEHEKVVTGYEPDTTNNRMELMAAIGALEAVKKGIPIRLTTDSKYLYDGIEKWIKIWERNGWKGTNKKQIRNLDLWKRLNGLVKRLDVEWHWIEGHSGHIYNEKADSLAKLAVKNKG